jgi:hypothetical protein
MSSQVTVQGVGNLAFDLPGLQFHTHVLTGSVGQLNIVLPGIRFGATGYTVVRGDLSFVLPGLRAEFHSQVPVTAIYKGFALNTKNFAVTEYGEFEFNSLVFFNGQYLGGNENGIYVLGGGKDMGRDIEANIKTGPVDFNRDMVKRPKDIWINNRSSDALKLTIKTDEGTEYEYDMTGRKDYLHEERVKVGRGIKGRFQSIGLTNVDGGDFDIDRISVLVQTLPTRRR